MFNVTFYSFSKKYNSTKRPTSGSGTTYSCRVLNGTAIIRPKIELDIGLTADPSNFNYAYIPNFDRYYYITEWSFDRGLWTANMSVDVLATYKTQIGAESLYILRASEEYDGTIIDNKYPTKTGCTFDKTTLANPFKVWNEGCYVVGCVSPEGYYGSLTYYVVDRAGLAALCSYLINDAVTVANNFDLNDASLALQRSIVDPIQYIKSVTWLPFDANDLVVFPLSTGLKIFQWDVPNTGAKILLAPYRTKTYTLNVIKHPDTNARGNYVNSAPYTLATLSFPPFGIIELDTSVLCNASTVDLTLRIDPIGGRGVLDIEANGVQLNRLEAQLGVPVQLSQVTSDYLGAVTSIAGAIPGVIGGFAAGGAAGIVGGVAGAISGIGNAIEALAPRAQSVGSSGGYTNTVGTFELDFQFFRPVADDIVHNGRPLCQKRTPASLGGYMLIQDGDVATVGTRSENQEIQSILESGFYYE